MAMKTRAMAYFSKRSTATAQIGRERLTLARK
jgi:hypothetical protein